jgi:fibronectin-binding autotransporter adhesin
MIANNNAGNTVASGLTKSGAGTVTLSNANNSYTGVTTVSGGILSVSTLANGSANSSIGASGNAAANVVLNNGGTLSYTGGSVTTDRSVTAGAGGGSINVSNGATTLGLGGAALGGNTLTKSGAGALAFSGTVGGSSGATLGVSGGTATLSGSTDNSFLGANITGGTLILDKASSSTVHALGGGITVGAGGTLKLAGSGGDQIFWQAPLTLAGGTYDTSGLSEGTSTLSLTSNSVLELGLNTSVVTFGGNGVATWNGILTINNWNGLLTGAGADQVLFTGISIANFQTLVDQSEVFFTGFGSGYNIVGSDNNFEMVAIPEPSTILMLLGGMGMLIGYRRRPAL